jgi:hypothetical protein
MDTPSPSGSHQDRKRKKDSPSPKEAKVGNKRRYTKARSKMAGKKKSQVKPTSESEIGGTIDLVANGLDLSSNSNSNQNSSSSADDAPLKQPRWLAAVLNEVRSSRKEVRTLSSTMTRGLKSLEKKLGEVTDSIEYESGRIDGVMENLEVVARRSILNKKDVIEIRRSTAEETKAVNTKVSKLERDLKTHMKDMAKQLETSRSGTQRQSTTSLPEIQMVIIDGISEVKNEDLPVRLQRQCFRHMGLNYAESHLEQCFRRGNQRLDDKGDLIT